MTLKEMEHRRIDLGITWKAIAEEVVRRYRETLSTQELSNILRDKREGDKVHRVKREVEEVLNDWNDERV